MRRYVGVLLGILCFCLTCMIQVHAAHTPVVVLTESDALLVAGIVPGDKTNDVVTATLCLDGEIVDIRQGTTVRASSCADALAGILDCPSDAVVYLLGPMPFGTDARSGTYTLSVSGHFLPAVSVPVPFTSIRDSFVLLGELMTASDKEAAVDQTGAALNLDMTAWETLGQTGRDIAAQVLAGIVCSLPDKAETSEELQAVRAALTQYRADFRMAVAVGAFADCDTAEEMAGWMAQNLSHFTLDPVILAEYPAYQDRVDAALSSYHTLDSKTALEQKIEEVILLELVSSAQYTKAQRFIEDYSDRFGIQYDDYHQLSEANKKAVYESLGGASYGSYQDVKTRFEEKAAVLLESQQAPSGGDGPSGSTGGGGNGGTRGGGSDIVLGDPSTPAPQPDAAFSDLSGVPWAQEAIGALYEMGVVSGRAEGVFDPNAPITRAELAKLIVTALEQQGVAFPQESTCDFEDVAASDWHYPYVAKAAERGIVLGDETGNFRPDAAILRQDLIVMLFRAMGMDSMPGTPSFADAAEIDAYAVPAVHAFVTKGLADGTGDNLFSPKRTATRAEAATLLYRVLTEQ